MKAGTIVVIVLGSLLGLAALGKWGSEEAERRAQPRFEKAIELREVLIGMTREQVRRSWGEPGKVNSTIRAGGTSEQWVYRWPQGATSYLYFEGDRLTTIQN